VLLTQQNLSQSIISLLTSAGRLSIILPLLVGSLAQAGVTERDQARRIHDRLTGVAPTNAVLDIMEAQIVGNDAEAAAFEAMKNPAFYNVTLKNYAAPWTNEDRSVFVPLNDYTATVVGMIRDDIDFREVLYGNIIYTGNANGVTAYSNANNTHYEQLEQLGPILGDLSNASILQQQTQTAVTGLQADATAGIMTTRAAAEAFFKDGTNRAMFRFTLLNHLCSDLEPLKDVSRVPDRVRQDVSRSPGGDSRIYMFSCVGCHAGMDGLGGAYAKYNFNTETEQLEYTQTGVDPKYLINADNFKPGYIATDDSWVNYWRNGQNKLLGWSDTLISEDPAISIDARGHTSGFGAKSMGKELANSKAFASCQVKKAFQAVCLHNPDGYADDRSIVESITADFMGADNYNMKSVFAKVAAYCK